MNRAKPNRIGILILMACAACSEPRDDAIETADVAAADSAAVPDSMYSSQSTVDSGPAVRLYPTLTDYPWYARGEPLRHEGIDYSPSGAPVVAPASGMQRAGEYQGVEFYVRTGASEPTVYVPVYRDYWQPFGAAPTEPAGG